MYFVKQCNLNNLIHRDNASEFEYLVSILGNLTDEQLSSWFCDNYIRRCVSEYPHNVRSFDAISSVRDLQIVLTAVSKERQRGSNQILYSDFVSVVNSMEQMLARFKTQSARFIFEQLQSIDSRLTDLCGSHR